MKTLGELLNEYEANGGTYPVRVCRSNWDASAWFEIVVKPRGIHSAVGYDQEQFPCVYPLEDECAKEDWCLWTEPKKVRKEKRFGWIDGVSSRVYAVGLAEHEAYSKNSYYRRAPWLDGEVEIEE